LNKKRSNFGESDTKGRRKKTSLYNGEEGREREYAFDWKRKKGIDEKKEDDSLCWLYELILL
jgi:hypothetical protein